jgi:hypothetical protein
MRKGLYNLTYWLLWTAFFACQEPMDGRPATVDAEIAPHVARFAAQAVRRGLDLSKQLQEVEVRFGAVASDDVYGQCTRSTRKRKVILINEAQWRRDDELAHERIIFHELGHCLLDLPHRNEAFSNGTCQSLMNGTESGFRCDQNYHYRTRSYYHDVLFGQSPETPAWAYFPFLNDFFTTTVVASVRNEHGTALSGVSWRLVSTDRSTLQVPLATTSAGPGATEQASNLTGTFDGKPVPDGTYLLEFSKKGFETVQRPVEFSGQGRLQVPDPVPMRFADRCLATLRAEFTAEGTEAGLGTHPARVGVEVSVVNNCERPVAPLKYQAYLAQGTSVVPVQEGTLAGLGATGTLAARQEVPLAFGRVPGTPVPGTALRPGRAVLILVLKSNDDDELFVFRYTIRLVA